jgi:cytochrome c oxidase assembly protein subunit 15
LNSRNDNISPVLRGLATATCLVALLPIGMGSVVTTLKAGMAFADWPSSDGQNMLLYPWFSDFAVNTEKFVEHGHRLAGMLIGFVAIFLALAGHQSRVSWIQRWTGFLLVAVIGQGLLGGARVLMSAQVLAMTHSITGALFFSCCVLFRFLLCDGWRGWLSRMEHRLGPSGAVLAALLPLIILGQYALGGVLRHLHGMRTEHVIGAVLTLCACLASSLLLLGSNLRVLRMAGVATVSAIGFQFSLGIGSLVTRFGFKAIGYVAVSGSLEQSIVCSLHTVAGMFLLATCCCCSVLVIRLHSRGLIASTCLSEQDSVLRESVA